MWDVSQPRSGAPLIDRVLPGKKCKVMTDYEAKRGNVRQTLTYELSTCIVLRDDTN
jgi:hypothetical protein